MSHKERETDVYVGYANASITAQLPATSETAAREAFCTPGTQFQIPIGQGVTGTIEVDRGIDIDGATKGTYKQSSTTSEDEPSEEGTDSHLKNPDVSEVNDLILSILTEEEFSVAELNGVVNLQLHHDNNTSEVITTLAEADYTFNLSQAFESPPHIKITRQIDAEGL